MSKIDILVEILVKPEHPVDHYTTTDYSVRAAVDYSEFIASDLAGYGLEVTDAFAPIPFSTPQTQSVPGSSLESWAESAHFTPQRSTLLTQNSPNTILIPARIEESHREALANRSGVQLWSDSTFSFDQSAHPPTANRGGIDCYPFKPAQPVETIRQLLGVESIWQQGFRGEGIIVAVMDQGIDGSVYPVIGGHATPGGLVPGQGDLTSHGSMCAAAVLLAAPGTKLYDYPLWPKPSSGKAIAMFEAMITQRKTDGTPHIVSNSYGLTWLPPQANDPSHESYNINHPLHRKIREVTASGITVFFSAGNCGQECPSSNCDPSSTGPGRSIHGANSLQEVITVAAVNAAQERLGYSSQGPGLFQREKPDFAAYTHYFGHYGPGRPGGLFKPYDDGTSAATPLVAGVAALLLSANSTLSPTQMKQILLAGAGATASSWNPDVGFGIVHAGASWSAMSYL